MSLAGLRIAVATVGLSLGVLSGTAAAAVTADPAVTILYVKGDAEANQIQVDCGTGIVLVNGTPAADGHANCADLKKLEVFGFGGDDTISLTGFPKHHDADNPFAELFGDKPEFAVYGGDGNDNVAGDAGSALYSGGAGNDVVRDVTTFSPVLLGGPGSDIITSFSSLAVLLGGEGADHLNAVAPFSFALGGKGRDVFTGGSSFDLAAGGSGADKMAGNGGRDLLIGEGGPDSLFGGGDADLLIGSAGRDRLRGGPGRDRSFQANPSKRILKEAIKAVFQGGPSPVINKARRSALRLLDLQP